MCKENLWRWKSRRIFLISSLHLSVSVYMLEGAVLDGEEYTVSEWSALYLFQYGGPGPGSVRGISREIVEKSFIRIRTPDLPDDAHNVFLLPELLFNGWKTQSCLGYSLTLLAVLLFSVFHDYIVNLRSRFKGIFWVVKLPWTSMLLWLEETLEHLDLGSWNPPFLVWMQGWDICSCWQWCLSMGLL